MKSWLRRGVEWLSSVGNEDEPVIFPEAPGLQAFGVLGRFVSGERIHGAAGEAYGTTLAVLRHHEPGASLGS